MNKKWISFPILIVCFGIIYLFFTILPKETAPYDDRSSVTLRMTTPEGSTYEYTDRFMQEISKLIDDSIPEKKVSLVISSPSFGSSSINTGMVRLSLKSLAKEKHHKKRLLINYLNGPNNIQMPKHQ